MIELYTMFESYETTLQLQCQLYSNSLECIVFAGRGPDRAAVRPGEREERAVPAADRAHVHEEGPQARGGARRH